jgi:mono/diheme cytochrome c family protein
LLCLVACASEKTASTDGAKLFGVYCATCHGPEGRPDATMVARLGVRDLTAPDVRARLTPAHVETQIRKGSQNRLMPAFEGAGLSDAQIRAMAEYVASPAFVKR